MNRRALLGGILLAASTAPATAAPSANLWPFWQKHDDTAQAAIDHTFWNGFLAAHVHPGPAGINLVDYAEVGSAGRQALSDDIQRLERVRITGYRRAEQFAYWVNLYNALTVLTVLQHYPVRSIRDIDISPGWFSRGPWDAKLLTIEGQKVSLNDIEHRILRPIWRDPRIHYALNCASLGCPNLARNAYTPGNTPNMLDQGARDYINSARGADVHDGKLSVSSIYVWYKADFGGTDAGVIAHLRKYAAPPLLAKLQPITTISSQHYDWRLNDASGPG